MDSPKSTKYIFKSHHKNNDQKDDKDERDDVDW